MPRRFMPWLAATTVLGTLSLLAGSAGAAVAATASDPWAQTNYNAAQSRANLAEKALTVRTVGKVRFLRRVTAPALPPLACSASAGYAAPVLAGGHLFTVGGARLLSYNAATGHVAWRSVPDRSFSTVYSSVAVSGGLVVIGGSDCGSVSAPPGILQAFHQTDGRLAWTASPEKGGGGPLAQLVVSGGIVVTTGTSTDGTVVTAHRLSSGALMWQHISDECGPGGTVLVAGGLVIANGCRSLSHPYLAAYRLATGRRAWTRGGAWQLYRGDAAGRHLYAAGPAGPVDLRPQTGQTQLELIGATAVLATDGSLVYARCVPAAICGYQAGTATELWAYRDGSRLAAEAGRVLYLSDGKALAAGTGKLLRRILPPASDAAALIVGEHRVAALLNPQQLGLYGLAGS